MLKKVECIIQPFKLEEVREALREIAVEGMTVSQVEGCGKQKGYDEENVENARPITFKPKVRLEIVTDEENVEQLIKTIQKFAKTGHIGDGKIFVYPVEDAIRIRTSERGGRAIK